MTAKKRKPGDAAALRRQAEALAQEKEVRLAEFPESLSPETAQRTLHELRVHQIELEMQNEELRRAQTELDTARSRYFDLYDLAPVGYLTLSAKGIILEANLAAATMLGLSRGALVKHPLSAFIFEEDQDVYYKLRKTLLETGLPQAGELRMLKKDGSPFWARLDATAAQDEGGAPGCRLVLNDVSERRRIEDALVLARDELEQRVRERTTELLQANAALADKIDENTRSVEALRESRARLAAAQRIAHLGGWDWDIRSGALIWSEEVFRIFGRDPAGKTPSFSEFLECTPAEDRERVEKTALQSVAEGKPFSLEHRIVLPDGEVRHVHAVAEAIRDENGAVVRMLGTILDITDRVRAENDARVRQQQLIQADKMASLGILVAGMAHEINNPNHSIMSNVAALAEVWRDIRPILDRFYEDFGDFVLGGFDYSECRDKLPDMFAGALSSSKRIEGLVTELRDFARHSPREDMAPTDVNSVIKSAAILMTSVLKKSTDHFSVEYAADLPPVLGNFQRIEQVVINLVQNACQALTSREQAVSVTTAYEPSSGSVLITVCDEGGGMADETLRQLGMPFFTTKRGREGTGLGLWISFNIVHEHGGTLTFSARKGGGTRALLALPALS